MLDLSASSRKLSAHRSPYSWIAALAIAAACLLALVQGIRTTADLTWAPGPDTMRDVASTESLLQGHPLSDPLYRGEWLWYNPLVPAIVAGAAAATGQATHVLYAHLGAYLNLAAPVTFALLAWRIFGCWTAVAAVVGFMFLLPGREPAWMAATYSPWLLPMNAVQSLFYLALLAMFRVWTSQRLIVWLAAGLATGVVLLGHTAPALILIAAVTLRTATLAARGHRDEWAPLLIRYALFASCVTLVSAPLLASIVGHYRLTVLNTGPGGWVAPGLELGLLSEVAREVFVPTVPGVISALGFVRLLRQRHTPGAQIVLCTGAATAVMFSWGYVVQYAATRGIALPMPVPHFHFLFYLRAFEAMLFGVGAIALAGLPRIVALRLNLVRDEWSAVAPATLIVALAVSVAVAWPAYTARPDFTTERDFAHQLFTTSDLRNMFEWILANTSPSDVILAREDLSLALIGTAGRKVVAVDRLFSNPFVDWEARARDRDRMFDAIERGAAADLMRIAADYRVRFVIREAPIAHPGMLRCCLGAVWSEGPWTIYRIGAQ